MGLVAAVEECRAGLEALRAWGLVGEGWICSMGSFLVVVEVGVGGLVGDEIG